MKCGINTVKNIRVYNGGWYISGEISRKTKGAIDAFRTMGKQCKDVSGGLPTFISPWIDGKKEAVMGTGKL